LRQAAEKQRYRKGRFIKQPAEISSGGDHNEQKEWIILGIALIVFLVISILGLP
jgi:hypothetical protein